MLDARCWMMDDGWWMFGTELQIYFIYAKNLAGKDKVFISFPMVYPIFLWVLLGAPFAEEVEAFTLGAAAFSVFGAVFFAVFFSVTSAG